MQSTSVPFVDLRIQHPAIADELAMQLEQVWADASFIMGAAVKEFEKSFAQYCGVRHALGVANGTDALILALKALDIGHGDEVITAVNSFVATAEAIVHAGAVPVFVDIDPHHYTLDLPQVRAKITPRTKAIIPVHLYGQPAPMDEIIAIARRYGLFVIEDAAQAHGATFLQRRVGSFGHLACFSFYPTKNLGAYGDAGAIATNDDRIALEIRKLREHGGVEKYQHDRLGYNSRLDTIQAIILRTKLQHLDRWNQMRIAAAQHYGDLFSSVSDIDLPPMHEGATHVYHLYVVRVAAGIRDALRRYLQGKGIQTGIHYPQPIHLTRAFAYLGHREGDFPIAEDYARRILSLPMFPGISQEQIEQVVGSVKEYLSQADVRPECCSISERA